jgi:hypothetical protein
VPLMENEARVDSMPTLLTPPTLERVLQGLHESEIRCGIQNEPPAGGITAWIDFGSQTEKACRTQGLDTNTMRPYSYSAGGRC